MPQIIGLYNERFVSHKLLDCIMRDLYPKLLDCNERFVSHKLLDCIMRDLYATNYWIV